MKRFTIAVLAVLAIGSNVLAQGIDDPEGRPTIVRTLNDPPVGDSVFHKNSATPFFAQNTAFIFKSRAGVITPQRTHNVGWYIDQCLFTSKYQGTVFRARWGIRAYGMEDFAILNSVFEWIESEHGLYLDVVGSGEIAGNTFDHIAAQAIQIVMRPQSLPPDLTDFSGVIDIYRNLILECGLWAGRGRAGFAVSLFPGGQGARVVENLIRNVEQQDTWPHSEPPGALMVWGRPFVELSRNVIDYNHMKNRPVVLLKSNEHLVWTGGMVASGKIEIRDCPNILIDNVRGDAKLLVYGPDVEGKRGKLIHSGKLQDGYVLGDARIPDDLEDPTPVDPVPEPEPEPVPDPVEPDPDPVEPDPIPVPEPDPVEPEAAPPAEFATVLPVTVRYLGDGQWGLGPVGTGTGELVAMGSFKGPSGHVYVYSVVRTPRGALKAVGVRILEPQ